MKQLNYIGVNNIYTRPLNIFGDWTVLNTKNGKTAYAFSTNIGYIPATKIEDLRLKLKFIEKKKDSKKRKQDILEVIALNDEPDSLKIPGFIIQLKESEFGGYYLSQEEITLIR